MHTLPSHPDPNVRLINIPYVVRVNCEHSLHLIDQWRKNGKEEVYFFRLFTLIS